MKLLKKIWIMIIGVLLGIKTLTIKAYGKAIKDPLEACDYGIIEPVLKKSIGLKILTMIAIPIILLVGLSIYFVKSKSKVWKKILVTIGIIAIYIILIIVFSIYSN